MDDDHGATIVSRYKRYKAGTKQIVNFLANTAAKHCDLRGVLRCLKDGTASHTTIQVKTHELLTLVKIITAAKSSTVPVGISKVLQDVIDGRQSCAGWYASKTSEEDTNLDSQNKSHLHFIGILQEVQQHLSGLKVTPGSETQASHTAKGSKRNKKAGKTTSDSDNLHNLFSYLEIQEPTDSPLGQHGPDKTAKLLVKSEYELEDDQETEVFALWCHLRDMSDTRLYLRDLWLEYRRGQITIEIAGVMTDIAIGILRHAHNDFIEIYPRFDDWRHIVKFLRLRVLFNKSVVCVTPMGECMYPTTKIKAATTRANDSKTINLLCPAAALLLLSFRFTSNTNHQLTHDRIRTPGREAEYFPREKRTMLREHPVTGFDQHLMSMLPVLNNICAGKGAKEKSSFLDGILRMDLPPKDTVLATYMVFAFQICMDINEIVDFDPSCGGDALLQVESKITATIDRAFEFSKNRPQFSGNTNANKNYMEAIRGGVACTKAIIDHSRLLEQPEKRQGMSFPALNNAHMFMAQNPPLNFLPHCAGNAVYHHKFNAHRMGVGVANEQFVMVLLAHFHKAAQRYGLVTAEWPDLNFLIARHSGKKPFITETNAIATDPYAMLKHYILDLGPEPSSFAVHKAPPPLSAFKALTPKPLMPHSALMSAAANSFKQVRDLGTKRNTYEILDSVLIWMRTKSEGGGRTSKVPHFSPIELLTTLKASMISDEPSFNFDYFGFTEMCLILLDKVLGSPTVPQQVHHGIYKLLRSAAVAAAQKSPLRNTAFARAASIMQSELESMDTKKFSQAALDASSGYIPEARHPRFSSEEYPSTEEALSELLEKFPDVSAGSGSLRDVFEFYNPTGSILEFDQMIESGALEKFGLSENDRDMVEINFDS